MNIVQKLTLNVVVTIHVRRADTVTGDLITLISTETGSHTTINSSIDVSGTIACALGDVAREENGKNSEET